MFPESLAAPTKILDSIDYDRNQLQVYHTIIIKLCAIQSNIAFTDKTCFSILINNQMWWFYNYFDSWSRNESTRQNKVDWVLDVWAALPVSRYRNYTPGRLATRTNRSRQNSPKVISRPAERGNGRLLEIFVHKSSAELLCSPSLHRWVTDSLSRGGCVAIQSLNRHRSGLSRSLSRNFVYTPETEGLESRRSSVAY